MPGWLKPLLLLCAVLPGVTLAQEVIEDFALGLHGDALGHVQDRKSVV